MLHAKSASRRRRDAHDRVSIRQYRHGPEAACGSEQGAEGVDTLQRMLSARSSAIHETKQWCVDSVQRQLNILESWAKKFEEDPDRQPIDFRGKVTADAAALKFGIEVFKELLDDIQKSKVVFR